MNSEDIKDKHWKHVWQKKYWKHEKGSGKKLSCKLPLVR